MEITKHFNLTRCFASVALALGMAACGTVPDNRSAQEVRHDQLVSIRVKKELKASPDYTYPNVDVTTLHGVVSLNGAVNTEQQRRDAVQRAEGVSGAVSVMDNLVVQPMPTGRPLIPEPAG